MIRTHFLEATTLSGRQTTMQHRSEPVQSHQIGRIPFVFGVVTPASQTTVPWKDRLVPIWVPICSLLPFYTYKHVRFTPSNTIGQDN